MLKLLNNKSPIGFGIYPEDVKINTICRGTNGKIYILKKIDGIKKWIIHDFYKEFIKSEKKLKTLLNKSVIKYEYTSIQDTLLSNPDYFNNQIKQNTKIEDIYFPSIKIKAIIEDKFDFLFFSIEHKMLCCLSDFYKYSIQTGHTRGDIFNNKKKKDFTFYYDVYDGCSLWKDFNTECKKYKNEMIEIIKNNEEIIKKSSINKQKYIKKYLL
jgi:hypothetical protein